MWPFKKKEISVSFAEYAAIMERNRELTEKVNSLCNLPGELVRMQETLEKSEDEVQKLRDQKELPKYQFGPVAPYGGYDPLRQRCRLTKSPLVAKVLFKDNAWLARNFGAYHVEIRSAIHYCDTAYAKKAWSKLATHDMIPYQIVTEAEYLDIFFKVDPTKIRAPKGYEGAALAKSANLLIEQLILHKGKKDKAPLVVVGTHTPQARYTVK